MLLVNLSGELPTRTSKIRYKSHFLVILTYTSFVNLYDFGLLFGDFGAVLLLLST